MWRVLAGGSRYLLGLGVGEGFGLGEGLGLGVGLGLGNHVAISTRGVIICSGGRKWAQHRLNIYQPSLMDDGIWAAFSPEKTVQNVY